MVTSRRGKRGKVAKQPGRPASFTGAGVKLTVNVPLRLYTRLKFQSAIERRAVNAIIIEIAEAYLRKAGMRR